MKISNKTSGKIIISKVLLVLLNKKNIGNKSDSLKNLFTVYVRAQMQKISFYKNQGCFCNIPSI